MAEHDTERSIKLATLENSPMGRVIQVSVEVAKKLGASIFKFSKTIIGLIFK